MKKAIEVVHFFNAGGENTYNNSEDAKFHDRSHREKIAFDEIQDLAIEKMKEDDRAKLSGPDCKISIDGKETTFQLPDDMTLDKFKSFLLIETGNNKFWLKYLLNNNQTLKELKDKSEIIEVFTKPADIKKFKLNMTAKFDLTHTLEKQVDRHT